MSTQRVNFLQKGAYALTYRNMIILVAGLLLFCMLIHGLFAVRHFFAKRKLAGLERAAQELSMKQQKVMAVMQASQSQQSNEAIAQSLAQVFSKMPVWSGVLTDLGNEMPKLIFLKSVKSSGIGDKTDIRKLSISGKGPSAGGIMQFVKAIEDSPLFQNVSLISSQKEEGGFSFAIDCEVAFPEIRW